MSGRGATASQRCAAQRGEALEVGDDPDQWGPHVSEGRGGRQVGPGRELGWGAIWAELGRKRKGEEKGSWAGLKRKREMNRKLFIIFLKAQRSF